VLAASETRTAILIVSHILVLS